MNSIRRANLKFIPQSDYQLLDSFIQKPEKLEQALLQHNILAISRIYDNITLSCISRRLGTNYEETLEAVENMIIE